MVCQSILIFDLSYTQTVYNFFQGQLKKIPISKMMKTHLLIMLILLVPKNNWSVFLLQFNCIKY